MKNLFSISFSLKNLLNIMRNVIRIFSSKLIVKQFYNKFKKRNNYGMVFIRLGLPEVITVCESLVFQYKQIAPITIL